MDTATKSVIPALPDEILSIICEDLGTDRDFNSLFNCALTSRNLADPALRTLYRYHEFSPAFVQSDEDTLRQGNKSMTEKFKLAERTFVGWTVLWSSIIASSLDPIPTFKPYCHYIRILDFRNLASMLEDPKFANSIRRDFFKGHLGRFHIPVKEGRRQTVHVTATINRVGDAVVPRTHLLEEISGHLTEGYLNRWVAHTPRLKNIVLYQGNALGPGTGSAIATHCLDFAHLTVHEWREASADSDCARFIEELQGDRLRSFEVITTNKVGMWSFQALGKYQSLQELQLGSLGDGAIEHLNALRQCTEIHTLNLEADRALVQLEAYHNDVFVEVIEWLTSCEKLRDLTVKQLHDGPAILAQCLVAPTFKLKKLTLEGYTLRQSSTRAFHIALAQQADSLECLYLKGDGEDASRDDLTNMLFGLQGLVNLRELELKDISNEMEEEDTIHLLWHMEKLETLWTSGVLFTSAILDTLSNFKHLKSLSLLAITTFSGRHILNFLEVLDPDRQEGFNLSVLAQDADHLIADHEEHDIRAEIASRFGGKFDLAYWRDADSSESDD